MIRRRLLEILKSEGATMEESMLNMLIESSGNDVRQIINSLQLQVTRAADLTPAERKKM